MTTHQITPIQGEKDMARNAFTESDAVTKLQQMATRGKELHVALLDIDGTWAVKNPPPAEELRARRTVRKRLEKRGVFGFITYRTPSLVLSSKMFNASKEHGLTEPEPHVGNVNGVQRYFVPLETLPEYTDALDPDVIAGIGSGLAARHRDHFVFDDTFVESHGSAMWRQIVLGILKEMDKQRDASSFLSGIDIPGHYERGIVDVGIIPYRVQLDFSGGGAFEAKQDIAKRFRQLISDAQGTGTGMGPDSQAVLAHLDVLDESNPAKGRYTLYLIPDTFRKEHVVDYVLDNLSIAVGVPASKFKVLLGGDTLTDLREAMFCAKHSDVTFVLPGGSRLEDVLLDPNVHDFAGEDITWIKKTMQATSRPGYYNLEVPDERPRVFVLTKQAYPGVIGPASFQAYLDDNNE